MVKSTVNLGNIELNGNMILKESRAYHTVDGGVAFCTFADATEAFNRVNYCKPYNVLHDCDIPDISRLLLICILIV